MEFLLKLEKNIAEKLNYYSLQEKSIEWAEEVCAYCTKNNDIIKNAINSSQQDDEYVRSAIKSLLEIRDRLHHLKHEAESFVCKYKMEQQRLEDEKRHIEYIKQKQAEQDKMECIKILEQLSKDIMQQEKFSDEKEREEEMISRIRREIEEWKKGRNGDLVYHVEKEKERIEELNIMRKVILIRIM